MLEAAKIDRADGLQTFRFITLPHLRQYIELSALLGSIYVLQTFDAIFTITQGGPGSATTNLPYEIYLTMFRKYEYGEAAAAGVVVGHRHDHRRHLRPPHHLVPVHRGGVPMSTTTDTAQNPFAPRGHRAARQHAPRRKAKDDSVRQRRARAGRSWPGC